MRIKSYLLLFLILLSLSCFVLASPFPPYPICQVTAGILKTGLISKNGDIKIISVGEMITDKYEDGYIKANYQNFSCTQYEGKGFTDVSLIGDDKYRVGQIIKADFSYGGDEFGHGYYMRNITIVSEAKIYEPMNEGEGWLKWFFPVLFVLIILYIILLVLRLARKKKS